jgi:hypothetical protein
MQQGRSGPESRVQVLGEGRKQGWGGGKFSTLTIKKESFWLQTHPYTS